jgi:hypothetical protein
MFDERCTIGSTGFAQVGAPDYWEKQNFEGQWLLNWFNRNFIMPDPIFIAWTSHDHDFGTYHEIEAFFSTHFMSKEEIDAQLEFIETLREVDLEEMAEKIKEDWLMLKSAEAIEKDDGSHLNLVG